MFAAIWHIAFGTRPSPWSLPAYLIWALFGNAEDGPYGFLPRDETKPDPNWRATLAWWMRNPMHNLTHYTLARGYAVQRVVFGQVAAPNALWPVGSVLLAINGLPCLSFRAGPVEGYAGWRPRVVAGRQVGVFGLALRRVKATS